VAQINLSMPQLTSKLVVVRISGYKQHQQ